MQEVLDILDVNVIKKISLVAETDEQRGILET